MTLLKVAGSKVLDIFQKHNRSTLLKAKIVKKKLMNDFIIPMTISYFVRQRKQHTES